MSTNYPKLLLLILILGTGVLFRLYNVSFDDLWYDEIISFWVANPIFSNAATFNAHNEIEDAPFLYNFILKFHFLSLSLKTDYISIRWKISWMKLQTKP